MELHRRRPEPSYYPRIDADGRRVVVSSEIGTLYVLGARARSLATRRTALPIGAWLPRGDLARRDVDGGRRAARSRAIPCAVVDPPRTGDPRHPRRAPLAAIQCRPPARVLGERRTDPAPLSPNLLTETRALVNVTLNDRPQEWQNPIKP